MATLEQLQRAYETARRDGDVEDAKVLERALRQAGGAQQSTRPSSEEVRRRYLASLEQPSDFRFSRPGFLENVGAGLGSGFVGTGELAALGAASLLEEEKELAARQRIQDVAGAVRPEGGDPDSVAYKLASGLGSIAGIAAPAVAAAFAPVSAPVAAGIGLGGAAALGVGAGAGEASERARAAGATEEERSAATLRGAAIGSLEVVPLTRIFRRLPKIGELFAKGGDEVKENVGTIRRLVQEPKTALGRTGRTGVGEGLQEAAAGILQNLNERGYNVERELVDAGVLEEGAIGAGSGAILQGIVELFTRGKSRGAPVTEESPATEEEIVEEQQLLALPAPARPDELVQVRMPDGSVQEVPAQVVEEARRKEREAREVAVQQEQQKRQEAIQEEERRGSTQIPSEFLDDRLTADMSPEERARTRAQDEQIDAFTAERQAEQAKVDRKERQDRRAATRLGLRGDRIEEQLEIPGSETEVQREMFGRKRVKGKTQVRGPDGTIQEVPSEEPTVKRQKVTPESERLMTKPAPAPEQQEMRLEEPRAERKQIVQPLVGPKGGIPRRRKEPFREPVAKPATQEPAPQADVLTKERLDTLGIAPSMQSVLVNKDVNKPETQRRLRNFAGSKRGSEQARANVTRLLDGVSEKQTDLFAETGPRTVATGVQDASVAEPQQAPSGVSVSPVVPDVGAERAVPPTQPDTAVAVPPTGTRVGDTGRGVGESVRGAVAEQPPLSELDQQLLARLEDKTKPLTKEEENTIGGQLTLRVNTGDKVSPQLTGLFVERVRGREQEIAKQKDTKRTKTTTGTKPGKKTTTRKQVTRKAKTPAVPAKEKRKSRTVAGVVKRGTLSRPKIFEIPNNKDPVLDADVDKVEARLKETTSREKDRSKTDENAALEAYFGRDERVVDALDRAIHDVANKSPRFTAQEGVSEETKAYFAQSSAKNAEQVLAWAKKNLSKETNQWIEKRVETKKKALERVTKRTKEVLKAEVKEAEKPSELKAQSKKTTQRVIRDYVDDAAYASKEASREQRELDAEIKAIEEFFDDLPYELRTDDVMLGNELHPVTTSLLREGKLGEALRVLASLTSENRVRQLANKLADNVGSTKVEFFSDTKEGSLAGGFDPQTNTIKLNEAYGASQHTLLHEMVHAVASATLAKPSHPLTKQLNTLFNDVKDSLGTAYGAKNLDEFVSEAMSNPEFRAELAGINPDGSNINALQRFLDSVGNFLRRLVGMKTKDIESAQTRADALIDEILAPAPEYRDADTLAMSSTAAGVKKVMSAMGSVQKGINKNNPLTEKGRKEFGQSYKQFRDIVGEEYGNIPLKFFDMSAAVDAARATNEKLGTVAQKALVAMERMRGASAQRDEATHDAIQPMERWFDNASPEETKLFNDIIYSREYGATIFQVDPTLSRADAKKKYEGKPVDGNDLWAIWQENQKQWNKLANTGGQKVYKDMQAFYKKQFEELKQVLFSRIETMADGDAQTVAKLKTEFEKRLFDKKGMDVYFPLIREGKYKIGYRYKPGKTPKGQDNFVFEIHQNRSDWLTQLREIESSPDMELVRSSDNENFRDYADKAPSSSFVNQTLQLLRGSKVDEATQEAFMRMVVTTLPESSLARALQTRKNTAGHETDALYAIKTKGFDIGRQVERLKFSASIQNVLSDLEGVAATEKNKFSPEEEWKLTQSVKDIQDRMQFAMGGAEYKNVEGIVRVANQTAFLFTIGFNTASAIVQTAQIPMVVMPMMMAKYGVKPTLEAMYRAMRIVMSARNHRPELAELSKLKGKRVAQKATDLADKFSPAYGLDAYYKREGDKFVVRNDIELTNAEIKELKDLAPLVKEASDRGHLNRSFMADALGLLEGGKAKRNDSAGQKILSGLDTGTAISAMMFNQAERFNRQVSMLLSYDLAKQDAKNKGKSIDEGVLIENAFRETHQLNGGSTLETAPPILRENIGRMAGMYKSYGMRMYTTMFNVGATALGQYSDMLKAQGVPDAEIKERVSIARKQSLGILGSSVFFSGVSGVPIYGAIELAVDAFKDDEDDDFNTIVRDYVGEGWYKGAVNQILSEAGVGIDVASRVRLTGLLVQANRYNSNPSVEETIGFYMGGPALSVGKRLIRGGSDIADGEFQRGVENLLPVGISNALKVLGRYQQDGGIYSRRNDPIYDDITGGELVGQFFGFAPSEYTRIQENNQRVKRIDTALSRKASKLRKQYYLATRQRDYSSARKVMREIAKYNRAHPNFAITQESIDRSMKQHMKTSAEMYNGVTLSPAMRRLLNDQLEAERNGFVAPK